MNRMRMDIPWVRRTLFLSTNCAAVLAIVGFFILPLFESYATRDAEIAKQSEVLARLRAIADRKPVVQETMRQRSK